MWTFERLKPKDWKDRRVRYKQYKYNGHRFTLWKQRDRRLVGFEREIRPDLEMTVKRPKIVEYEWWKLLNASMPPMSCVDGELYVPLGNAGDAAHAIAECSPELEFAPFAVPWWKDCDLSSNSLTYVQSLLHHYGIRFIPFFELLDSDDKEQLLKDAVDLGIEGWVLKDKNYLDWWKVKPVKDLDVIITKLKWAERGKYLGAIGSLHCSAYMYKQRKGQKSAELVEIACVSGMDDEIRWDIDEKDVGRVIEVEYQELGNGNRLVHPRFVRWRDDKPAKECTYTWRSL